MYHEFLERIGQQKKAVGLWMQPPCPAFALENLREKAIAQLGQPIPDAYAILLGIMNGLSWDGLIIYAAERSPIVGYSDRFIKGFLEANQELRQDDSLRDYLVFAEDCVCFFAYNTRDERYEVLTRAGLTVLEVLDSFDDLLVNAFKGHP